jgi:hypothetical protein
MNLSPVDPNDNSATEEPRELCSNCGKKMAKKGKFCPHCGQKRFEGRIPLKELTGKFFYKLTNLDSKLLRMMWRLLIPGQVSLDYFSGKIKQYPHPFQFFFVVMFFFLLAYNKLNTTGDAGIHFSFSAEKKDINLGGKNKSNGPAKESDFYFLLQRYVFSNEIREGFDSLPPRLQTPAVNESLQIILEKTNGHWTRQLDSLFKEEKSRDSLGLNFGTRVIRIAYKDVVEYSPDELVERYKINDWLGKTLLRQGVRSLMSPQDLINAYIGSFSWTILALIIVMAGGMHLFYWRQKRYYVEHFIVLMHWHSGALLVLTLTLIWNYFLPLGEYWGFIILGIFVFLWFTMKRFYRQNWFWTTFKWFWFSFFYLIGFTILFVVGLLVVFTFF